MPFFYTKIQQMPQRKGFTLTEIAIVLGVVGIIISAIWSASSVVHERQKITQMQREMLVTVSNIRALYYGNKNFITGAAQTVITPAMVNAGVFPVEMIDSASNTPLSPWGGAIIVYASTSAPDASSTQFEIQVGFTSGTPLKAMCNLLGMLAIDYKSEGLTYLFDDNGWHSTAAGNLDVASFSCSSGNGNFSTDWNLRGGL